MDIAGCFDVCSRRVYLERRRGGTLGLTVRGGQERGTGVFVSALDPGGHAQLQGLCVGDRVLKVNELDFRRISHQRAVEVLRTTPRMIMCVTSAEAHRMPSNHIPEETGKKEKCTRVKRNHSRMKEQSARRCLHLVAEPDGYLGFSIRGGSDCSAPVCVTEVDRLSPAFRAGLRTGDVITNVNGVGLDGLTHMQVVGLVTAHPKTSLHVIQKDTQMKDFKLMATDISPSSERILQMTVGNREQGPPRPRFPGSPVRPKHVVNIAVTSSTKQNSEDKIGSEKVTKLLSRTIRLNLDTTGCDVMFGAGRSLGQRPGIFTEKLDFKNVVNSLNTSGLDKNDVNTPTGTIENSQRALRRKGKLTGRESQSGVEWNILPRPIS